MTQDADAMANQTAADRISLPRGGSGLAGIGETFQPYLHTDTGYFSIPIGLPPGRNGVQPQLALAYSTGHGNGPSGRGWSLSVPGMTRKTDRGMPRYRDSAEEYDDRDTFILSGAEDLVAVEIIGGADRGSHPRQRREHL
jgi:Salmonella virulence plasmid 65kDa B protein